jgi:uncharacterized protein
VRLKEKEIFNIVLGVSRICGKTAKIWLFGSRADESKKGGDIDLYIEVDPQVSDFDAKLKLMSFFQSYLGERKIDLLIRPTNQPMNAMHELAKSNGIEIKIT